MADVLKGEAFLKQAAVERWQEFTAEQLASVIVFLGSLTQREDQEQVRLEIRTSILNLAGPAIRLQIAEALRDSAKEDVRQAEKQEKQEQQAADQEEITRQRALRHYEQERGNG